jgi:hypothetical protein
MNRPLLISDCDEVLLHMMQHFGAWLASEHHIDFVPQPEDFGQSMRYRGSGELVSREDMWTLLGGFFTTEMHRQTLVPHALEALGKINEVADIVILTNLSDDFHASRVAQLDAVGIRHHVVCNLGPKGPAVAKLIASRKPGSTVFVDDIAGHHRSVSETSPEVWRLHMVADPEIARLIPPAPAAHKRIDDWAEAVDWVVDRLMQV